MNEKPALTLSFTNEHVSSHCSQADIIVVVCNHFFFSNAVNLVNVRQIFTENKRNTLLMLQSCCRCCSSSFSFWRLSVRGLRANESYSSFPLRRQSSCVIWIHLVALGRVKNVSRFFMFQMNKMLHFVRLHHCKLINSTF